MNYKKVYDKIIENRLNNPLSETEYGETHHIIPRSLGGSDEVENLVRLTAREHFICHALLAEMYERETLEWYKMNHAFMMMKVESSAHNENRYINSRLYSLKKEDFSSVMSYAQTGKKNSQYGKVWIYNLELEQSIKVNNIELDSYLENEWVKGRVLDFNKFKAKLEQKQRRKIESKIIRQSKLEIDKQKFTVNGVYFSHRIRTKIHKLFNINMCDGNLIDRFNDLHSLLYKLYHIEKMSTVAIADKFNSNFGTIVDYMNMVNVSRRSLSDSLIQYNKYK